MNAAKAKTTPATAQSAKRDQRLYQVLVAPHVSEKTTRAAEKHRQITFRVLRDADKREIKAAVEKIFSVKVQRVTVVNQRGKFKYFQRTPGQRSSWKKAYVTLAEGHDIDFATAEA
ncbi:MAG: 50S ribosomal protein L23 [Gammaproteobacteria bacterium]|nr:50S ribosomal protein L23 [Gammaproteobacteria bacterium]MDD9798967.1 50S ribosomal protein L23 [Gammaproteobacteria bacterium]MDD9815951.1 50S ribosomal protein L23 [Gammaproteobacteria bacterium]MDD9850699.1 50S ribosomal protein L23 [Gammaproteobacteria bacterium]MDD9870783.1 50S ribosomal protein L23 [Gammaproteobacteria bacterium]